MDYEKPPTTATTFSRKMTNRSHSHSLSFSANAVYDGVFASPTNMKSPMVDYGEIFRGSGPSPSSIPFLDVPELNVGKVKVDVRSSKLDYSSVFGGFGACDFAVTPNEVIVESQRNKEKRRNRRKGGSSSDEVKNLASSPEMVRMKHSDILLHQTGPRNENVTTHLTQLGSVPAPSPTQLVGDVSPVQKIAQGNENGTTRPARVDIVAAPTQLVDNTSLLQKVESKTPIPSVEKKTCSEGVEEVQASRKRSSKTEVDFEKIFSRNECSTPDNSTCKSDSIAERRDVKPPSSLQRTLNGENGASERSMGFNSGLSERFQAEDDDSPSSPPFFDAETDLNSFAAESSAALKKALEEAQVRMNIAKQMMERKKSGFRSSAKLKCCDDLIVEGKTEIVGSSQAEETRDEKVEGKTEESRENSSQVEEIRDEKVEGKTEESKENSSQVLGEMVNSSEQSFSNEGDQHAKRARKLWAVPEGLINSTSDHKREEIKEQDVGKLEEEQARRGRKHWELPGGIFKSVMSSKQQEPEGLAPAKPETDTKQEVQPLTENPFYAFGQLGSKIKCVVEAFTGSKGSQKDETHATEEKNSILPQMVQPEEGGSQEMLASIPAMETYFREVEEIPRQTESAGETKQEEQSESKMSTFAEGCSEMKEKETEWEVKSGCESEDGRECVKNFQENSDPTYNILDQEGEKEIVSGPQEMFVGPDDTKTYAREVEEIPTPNESLSRTHFDESVGAMVSFVTENTPEPGNIHEETEHKAPRRRRVWKTSEDVYNMIRAPKGNNRPWQLPSTEIETTQRSFQMEGVMIHDASEETENTAEQASDSGLQENWTVLKQMFRQMFQTADTTKGEDETYCLVESEKEHIDIHQKAGDASYCQINGTESYEQNEVETEYKASAHTRENEELESAQETNSREEDGKEEVQEKESLVGELIGEELKATGMASGQEGEYVPEVFEKADWAQGLSELDEIREHPDSRAEMLEYNRSETDSNKSCEKFEQTRELAAEETKIDGSIDTGTSRSSFETRQGDSYTEEVGFEQDLSDLFHEKNSAASSTEEHVEEIDSDSIQSGWSVLEDDDKIKSYVEESLAGHRQDGETSKVEEIEETKEESDDMKTSSGEENKEDKTYQEHRFECQKEEVNNVEPGESSCCMPKGENSGAETYTNIKENEGEESCRSSMEEEGDATSDDSQKEAERVEKHLKKKDEAKEKQREKEKERSMVERAIREARERAFADAKERAGKAAIEKAKAGVHRKGTSEVPRRSEKVSVEVNDKLSSAEKASMQAKLRAERAAVERALSEARERALEKALSGKSAASQTRVYGGSKSFSSSGERRGSSSSQGTENKSSGPSSSSNQTAKGEPIQRCKARSERHHRTSERAAEALAEKKLRDLKVQKEEAERNRLAESLDADVKRWSNGKENNLRALLSTLQYILGAESGWKPIPLTDLVSSASVRKAYRKATLYVHPDKLQQRGASTQQKYICEKVFDLLKEAWNKFGAD